MTTDSKAIRALIAEEADKQPLRIQFVRPKPEPAEVFIGAMISILGGGGLLMFGLQAAHHVWPSIPAAGYADCVFLVVGLQALGASLGLSRTVLR